MAGGLVAGAYVTRDQPASRDIAAGSAALGGAVVGMGVGVLVGELYNVFGPGTSHNAVPYMIVGSIVGGSLGGWAGYAASSSPSSRPWVTSIGLAIPYALTLVLPL